MRRAADPDRRGHGQRRLRLRPSTSRRKKQIEEAETRLFALAESGKYGQGFLGFGTALTTAIEMASSAYQRDGHLSGLVDRASPISTARWAACSRPT